METPRPTPLGKGFPQPAFSAARSRTALARGVLSRRTRRYATGSCFAAVAISSMKLSVTNTLCDGPTLRQNAVGMPGGSTRTYSTCMFGNPYTRSIAPSVLSGSRPFLNHPDAHLDATEEPAKRLFQATGIPFASRAAEKIGRA